MARRPLSGPAPGGKSSRPEDRVIRELLQQATARDAAPWLLATDGVIRTFGEWDEQTSRVFLARLQAAGAVRVVASRITRHVIEFVDQDDEVHENTGHLVVELPDVPSSRRRVFRIVAKQARSLGFEPTPDTGQRHLFIALD